MMISENKAGDVLPLSHKSGPKFGADRIAHRIAHRISPTEARKMLQPIPLERYVLQLTDAKPKKTIWDFNTSQTGLNFLQNWPQFWLHIFFPFSALFCSWKRGKK